MVTIRTGFPNSSHLLPIQKPPSGYQDSVVFLLNLRVATILMHGDFLIRLTKKFPGEVCG